MGNSTEVIRQQRRELEWLQRHGEWLQYQVDTLNEEKQRSRTELAKAREDNKQVKLRLGLIATVSACHDGHACPADDCFMCWPSDIINEILAWSSKQTIDAARADEESKDG